MARAEIPFTVNLAATGEAVNGASVQVNVRGGGAATVYAAETGSGTLGNPLATTPEGRIEGWLEEGSYSLVVSGGAIPTYTQHIEVLVGSGTSAIADNAVTTSKLAAGAVTAAKLATDVAETLFPAGVILMTGAAAAPSGWSLCDGGTLDGTQPANLRLWNAIGTSFGGTGQSSFKKPDLRGRAPVGAGAGPSLTSRTLGTQFGTETHALTQGELAAHTHGATGLSVGAHTHGPGSLGTAGVGDHGHTLGVRVPHLNNQNWTYITINPWDAAFQADLMRAPAYFPPETNGTSTGTFNAGAHSHAVTTGATASATPSISGSTASVGSGTAHPNTQPSTVVNFIIKL